MKQKNIKVWALAGLLGCAMNLSGQVTQPNNYVTTLPPYVGCDINSNQPLRIKTEADYPIHMYTDAVKRIQLLGTGSYTIGSFATQVKDDLLALGILMAMVK